ncbi:MAG TPA: DinB family protein [Bryobacteraceae bacterium]|nr:DinB family protein [Bryobacteraceae bacterium]
MAVSEIEVYRHQFEQIEKQARELTGQLDEARFNWRPSPAEWSIEECLAHLTMVGQWEIRAIEKAIEEGKQRGLTGHGPFQYGALDRFVVHQTEPPVRNPLPTSRHFVPLHGQPLTAVMPTFYHVQSQLSLQLQRADGLDLRRVKVATPISRFLKLSLGAMFAQIAAHERRHLNQACRVREQLPL